eukprot:jgi/Botrbrau1/3502/Bobra.341_2s0032.1
MSDLDDKLVPDELLQLRDAVNDILVEDPVLRHWCDESCLKRFLVSRGGNLRKAVAALRHTLEWRQKEKPHATTWEAVEAAGYHGRLELLPQVAKDGRPVILYRVRLRMEKMSGEDLLRFWVYWLESASHIADKHESGKIIIVADFQHPPGVWIPPLPDRLHCLRIAQAHYPERLSLAIVANPASLFWFLWYGIQPFMDPVTRSKVALLTKGEEVTPYLGDLLDKEHMYETLGGQKPDVVDVQSVGTMMRRIDQERQALLAKALGIAHDE